MIKNRIFELRQFVFHSRHYTCYVENEKLKITHFGILPPRTHLRNIVDYIDSLLFPESCRTKRLGLKKPRNFWPLGQYRSRIFLAWNLPVLTIFMQLRKKAVKHLVWPKWLRAGIPRSMYKILYRYTTMHSEGIQLLQILTRYLYSSVRCDTVKICKMSIIITCTVYELHERRCAKS